MCGYNSAATMKHISPETFTNIEKEAFQLPEAIGRFIEDRKIKLSQADKLGLFAIILGPHFSLSDAAFTFRAGDKSLINEIVLVVQKTLHDKGYKGFKADSVENSKADANVIKTKIGELFCNAGKLSLVMKNWRSRSFFFNLNTISIRTTSTVY